MTDFPAAFEIELDGQASTRFRHPARRCKACKKPGLPVRIERRRAEALMRAETQHDLSFARSFARFCAFFVPAEGGLRRKSITPRRVMLILSAHPTSRCRSFARFMRAFAQAAEVAP